MQRETAARGRLQTCFDLPLAVQLSPLFGVVSFRPTRGLPTRAGDGWMVLTLVLRSRSTCNRGDRFALTGFPPRVDYLRKTMRWRLGPRSAGRSAAVQAFTASLAEQGSSWCGCSSGEVGGPSAPSPGYGCRCASDCATWGQTRRVTEQLGQRVFPLFHSPAPHLASA